MDNTNRLLVPARLLSLVSIDKDKEVILAGQLGKIELWSKELYDQTSSEIDDFGELANRILGGNIKQQNE